MQNGQVSQSDTLIGTMALLLKDGLRGARHTVLHVREIWLRLVERFPAILRKPLRALAGRFDDLALRVERRTSYVAHRYLDPDIIRDSETATFSKIIQRRDAPVVFAKTTYDTLKFIVAYCAPLAGTQERFFISEMLSACAYRKAAPEFTQLDSDHAKAGVLNSWLLRQGVVRTHRSLNAARVNDEKVADLARIVCFANMLWLMIARDYVPEREEDLLVACCDLSLVIGEQIAEAGENPESLARLLKTHAEII